MVAALRSGGLDRARWISRLASIAVLAIALALVVPAAAISAAFADPARPPVIAGLPATQEFDEDAIGAPFAAVTITSVELQVTAALTWSAADLVFEDTSAFTGAQGNLDQDRHSRGDRDRGGRARSRPCRGGSSDDSHGIHARDQRPHGRFGLG